MAMVSDENGCGSTNGSGGAGQGSCEAGLRWKRWDGMKREREGKKNVGEVKGVVVVVLLLLLLEGAHILTDERTVCKDTLP